MNSMSLNEITKIGLYTGSHGKKECTCNCKGCCFGNNRLKHTLHQGTPDQIQELLNLLPNLKSVLIFGNPDVSVDPEFCNYAAKLLQSCGIIVAFNTSGYGGRETLKTVLNGLNFNMVRFVDFSLDTLDNKNLTILKGTTRITVEIVLDAIKYCTDNGIPTGVKPTIWQTNIDDDWNNYYSFLKNSGVSRFKFHFGSIEGVNENVEHVSLSKISEFKSKYKDLGMIPQLLLTESEYATFNTKFKPRCLSGNGPVSVFLGNDGIKGTVCTSYSAISSAFVADLKNGCVPLLNGNFSTCPSAENALGFVKYENRYPVCRYYMFNPKMEEYCM